MKVIGVNGSARRDGNTAILIRAVFEELEPRGVETRLLQLHDREIAPCRACFACGGRGRCVFDADDFGDVFDQLCGADGILLGSPVYSADISAKMKALLERAGVVAAGNPGLLQYKVGAGVAAVRRGGGMAAVDTLNHFFLNKEMIVVGATYWNMVYGKDIGDVRSDEEGMRNLKSLGRNMAWVLERLHGARP